MRVNVESDLWASGRLGAFARALGVGEREALGVLVYVWHETQHRELMMVTADRFAEAISIRLGDLDSAKVLEAMAKAQLMSRVDNETWLIRGNDEHVERLRQLRSSASAGGQARGKQKAALRQAQGSLEASTRLPQGKHKAASTQPRPSLDPASTQPSRSAPYSLLPTPKDHDLDPDLTEPSKTEASRSSVSSDAKNSVGLSASPSAAADALSVLDLPKPKRKERSPEQKKRSVGNARLYCELYEQAEGHPPTGLDQSFYGAMAKFSDKHAEGAEQILRWVFQHCPDKGFRAKGWPLPLIIEQAPRLWRELNNPRAAVENIAAPRQQQQMALAASNDLAFEEYHRRKLERLAGSAT